MANAASQPTEPTILNRALKDTRRALTVVFVFSFFLNILYLVTPMYMMSVYDRVLGSGHKETLLFLTLIALTALIVLGVLDGLRLLLLSRLGSWLNKRMGPDLIEASIEGTVNGRPIGSQALRDMGQIQAFVGGQGIIPFFDAPWAPVFLGVIFIIHPVLGIIAIAAAIVLFLCALLNELITRKPLQEASQAQVQANDHADRAMRNAEVVKAMGMLPGILNLYRKMNAAAASKMDDATRRGSIISGFSKFFRMATQIAILGTGALFVLAGEITPGTMIASSILMGRALAPIEQSINAWKMFVAARTSYKRLQLILQHFTPAEPGMPLPDPRGALHVDDLIFKPETAPEPIINRINLKVPPGKVLAVIGPSAAGKSTLCRLIVGVNTPTRGCVRLDGADVRNWNPEQFGRHVGYLPQDVELFSGTIKDNIARMQEADPEAVIAAAKLADVHELILRMPNGYDTEIGPRGAVLSGGQRQRIGLARALFGDPKLVVLDEPNSNLDQEGEGALMNAIGELKKREVTVILVAHRPSALVHVDRIAVLRDGAVELYDERDKVLEQMAERRKSAESKSASSGHVRAVETAGAGT